MGIEKVILEFPCLFMKIWLDARVQELPDIDQFDKPKSTIDMGFIRDVTNPMVK